MKNLILAIGITIILPFFTWGSTEFLIEENNNPSSQIISQNKKFEKPLDQQELFQTILELDNVDDFKGINIIFDENPEILSDALKVWATINNVRVYNEIPKEKYLFILGEEINTTKFDPLKALYYDTLGLIYIKNGMDIGMNYLKKGGGFGCGRSYYNLALYQLKKENEKKDFVYLARVIKEDIEKIKAEKSFEKYKQQIRSCLDRYLKETEDEEKQVYYSPGEKEVIQKTLNSLSELEYINSLKYYEYGIKTEYKEAVIEKLEYFSETGKYAQEKLKKIVEGVLKEYATEDEKYARIINEFPEIAAGDFDCLEWLEKFQKIDDKYEKTITSMIDCIIDEIFKQCLPNYEQPIKNILQAKKLKFEAAEKFIEQNITDILYDYCNLSESINHIKNEILRFLESDQNEFIKSIFKIGTFFNFNENIKSFKNRSFENYTVKIHQDTKIRFLKTLKILHIFAKDFKNKKAEEMLCYEVEHLRKIEAAVNRYGSLATNIDYILPIRAAELLLDLGITHTDIKVHNGMEIVEVAIDIKKSLGEACYNQAIAFARVCNTQTDLYAFKALEHGYEGTNALIFKLAKCYNQGSPYDRNSIYRFSKMPRKALDLYIKFIESTIEKSKEDSIQALDGILQCIPFITLRVANGENILCENDINILKKGQVIINSSQIEGYNYYLLNYGFNQLYTSILYNTAFNLLLSKNETQDFDKAKKSFEIFLNKDPICEMQKKNAKRYIKIINLRKGVYKKILEDLLEDDYKDIKLTLLDDKVNLGVKIAADLIKNMNKHDAFLGIGNCNVFPLNAQNEKEIDLIFELFSENVLASLEKNPLMTKELALEVRKFIFPRNSDD